MPATVTELATRIEERITAKLAEWRAAAFRDCVLCHGDGWVWGPVVRRGVRLPGPDQPVQCPICLFTSR